MTACQGTRSDGSPCKGTPGPGAIYCFGHDPAQAEARKRRASKGGETAGKGRPLPINEELTEIRNWLKGMAGGVYKGEVDRSVAVVINQICNTRLRLIEVEDKLRQSQELEARLAALEEKQNTAA